MATPGQMVQTMADVLGIPAATVSQYDRQLAEAGLRTTGGRGPSAAKVGATDAANLLIAILGSPVSGASIRAAQQICETLGSQLVRPKFSNTAEFRRYGLHSLVALPKTHTFREVIAALIEGVRLGELFRIENYENQPIEFDLIFKITVVSPRMWAQITVDGYRENDQQVGYCRLIYSNVSREEGSNYKYHDLRQERTISFLTLRTLGALIASDME